MDVFSLIRLMAVCTAALVFIEYVSMKKDRIVNELSPTSYLANLLKVLLFTQVIALLLALIMGGEPESLWIGCSYGAGMGFLGYSGLFLAKWFNERRGLTFFSSQIIEFVVILTGITGGAFAANVIMHFVLDLGLLWDLDDPFSFINLMVIGGIVMSALLVASIRIFYNFKLYTEQEALAQREMDVLRLKEQATSAQLQMLQTRINPHFLYNALNSIASLVHEDPDRAEKMTMALSRLFRASLNGENSPCTTVEKEVALVKTYLEIEEIRFGDRLSTTLSVDPKALNDQIPRFLLQPLVENAVKHGVAGQDGKGHVGLEIHKKDNALEISVKDNGPDFPGQMTGGYGWKSVSDSLDLLYPERHELYLVNGPEKHVHLTLWNQV